MCIILKHYVAPNGPNTVVVGDNEFSHLSNSCNMLSYEFYHTLSVCLYYILFFTRGRAILLR